MRVLHNKYLIKGLLDHKESYTLSNGIELKIDKSWDNNLRTRNSQLGVIAELTDKNELGLAIGDTVIVHHFSFHGDISENKGFQLQQHIEHNGELYFTIHPDRIFAKYNNKTIEPLGQYVFCKHMQKPENKFGLILPETAMIEENRAMVTHGNGDILTGDIVLFPNYSMYEIILDKVPYQRVMKRDIYGYIRNGEMKPYDKYFLAKDEEVIKKSGAIDLSLTKPKGKTSTVIQLGDGCDYIKEGEKLYRGANSGLKYEDNVLLNSDHIHFKVL